MSRSGSSGNGNVTAAVETTEYADERAELIAGGSAEAEAVEISTATAVPEESAEIEEEISEAKIVAAEAMEAVETSPTATWTEASAAETAEETSAVVAVSETKTASVETVAAETAIG